MDPLHRQAAVQGLFGILMYAGAVWLFVGMPLALGSWWSLLLILPFVPVLLWRLLDEERMLQKDLPGYTEYMRRVRFRLMPFVW
jgi:protein-S-isoprenylcysteine O-methyltransferase Ste14